MSLSGNLRLQSGHLHVIKKQKPENTKYAEKKRIGENLLF